MTSRKFQKGDVVEILPQFQDEGDSEYVWTVVDDEEKGRVLISALNSALHIRPIHTVQAEWIKLISV